MKILVVGSGAREHALLWTMHRDRPDAQLFATRPNAGAAGLATEVPIAPTDVVALAGWAAAWAMDLVVVGPEAPLAAGLVDVLRQHGIPAFGPGAEAARIESSKSFAKDLMSEAGVPTAEYGVFTDPAEARAFVHERGAPIVVKASGLAAGKGVLICESIDQADAALDAMLTDHRFGEAGREVVIEEYMEGEELSVLALTDGEDALFLVPAQDHKRIGEGDTGLNTGGMGAYAPVSLATPELLADVKTRIVLPTLAAMAERGCPFRGVLYTGLMLTPDGPRVVEFNCRFGDPEVQVVLPLTGAALLPLMHEIALGGSIAGESLASDAEHSAAVTTVLASAGYPGAYEKGKPVDIPPEVEADDRVIVFHGGTRRESGRVLTDGGRVFSVTGMGETLEEAAAKSRAAADGIAFEGKTFRRDIGWRELARRSARPA